MEGWSSMSSSPLLTKVFTFQYSLVSQWQPYPNAESIYMKIAVDGVKMLFKIIIINRGINAQLQLEHRCILIAHIVPLALNHDMINGYIVNYFTTASTFTVQFWKQLI